MTAKKPAQKGAVTSSARLKYMPLVFFAALLTVIVSAALIFAGGPKPAQPKSAVSQSSCGPYKNDLTVKVNGASFKTELAGTDGQKQAGLSGRPCILSDQAMLFPFAKDGHYAIWMYKMKFPIDVVWITSGRKIAAIERDFLPSSYPERRQNQLPAQYVLEIKANRTKELNMNIGTPVDFEAAHAKIST